MAPENCGLLVIDIQGKLARLVSNSDASISNTIKLIACCHQLSIPIVVFEQNPKGLGSTVSEIEEQLPIHDKFEKHTFSALANSDIKSHIKSSGKTTWLIAGIEAHICVYQTVKDLISEDFQASVLSDCIDSRDRSNVTLAIDNMRQLGAEITSLEMCLYELMKTSKHPKFRDILKIIKT